MLATFKNVILRNFFCFGKSKLLVFVMTVAAILISACNSTYDEGGNYIQRTVEYDEGVADLDTVTDSVFGEISNRETFAFVIPLFERYNDKFSAKGNIDQELLNSEYIFVYTPGEAPVNNLWYLISVNSESETASIIGRGGEIEYLKSDLYDAPGFDENDKRQCAAWSGFPQRRVQSCFETDCGLTLYLNGLGRSPSFIAIQGRKGWHLLRREGTGADSRQCVFDNGETSGLLKLGDF